MDLDSKRDLNSKRDVRSLDLNLDLNLNLNLILNLNLNLNLNLDLDLDLASTSPRPPNTKHEEQRTTRKKQSVSQTIDQVSAIKTHTESSKTELSLGGKGHFKVDCKKKDPGQLLPGVTSNLTLLDQNKWSIATWLNMAEDG